MSNWGFIKLYGTNKISGQSSAEGKNYTYVLVQHEDKIAALEHEVRILQDRLDLTPPGSAVAKFFRKAWTWLSNGVIASILFLIMFGTINITTTVVKEFPLLLERTKRRIEDEDNEDDDK